MCVSVSVWSATKQTVVAGGSKVSRRQNFGTTTPPGVGGGSSSQQQRWTFAVTWLLLDWVLPNGRKRNQPMVGGRDQGDNNETSFDIMYTHSLNQSSNWMAETMGGDTHTRPPWTHTRKKCRLDFQIRVSLYTFLRRAGKTWATGSHYVEPVVFGIC
jgi:hypothetical protein